MLKRISGLAGRPYRLATRAAGNANRVTGPDGSFSTGASLIAWNQGEGDYLEYRVCRSVSLATSFKAMERNRTIVAHVETPGELLTYRLAAWPHYFAFDDVRRLPARETAGQADYHLGAYDCSEPQFRPNVTAVGCT